MRKLFFGRAFYASDMHFRLSPDTSRVGGGRQQALLAFPFQRAELPFSARWQPVATFLGAHLLSVRGGRTLVGVSGLSCEECVFVRNKEWMYAGRQRMAFGSDRMLENRTMACQSVLALWREKAGFSLRRAFGRIRRANEGPSPDKVSKCQRRVWLV